MRLWTALRLDLLLQWRNGFYFIYAGLTVLYIIVLRLMPVPLRVQLFPIVLFSDPVMVGFYFVGGIVLLEKKQRVHAGLFTTPLTLIEYILAKTISLLALATLSSVLITLGAWGLAVNWAPLLGGVMLSSALFTLIGLAVVGYSRSLNHYLMLSAGVMTVTVIPLLHHFGVLHSNLFYLLPTKASLILLDSSLLSTHWGYQLYGMVFLLLWMLGAWWWALRVLKTRVVYPQGRLS